MSMPVYTNASERFPCDDDILEAAPENPVRFLAGSDLAWQAMVDGIDSLERLEAYRQAEKRHIQRENPSEKTRVHKYIDNRERELTGSVSEPTSEETSDEDREPPVRSPTPETTPDAEADPVPATDGGTELSYSEEDTATDEPDVSDEPEADPGPTEPSDLETHPDATALEAGRVLVVELETEDDEPAVTEYVWPAEPGADLPYILESHTDDAADPEQLTLSKADLFDRVRNDNPEERPIADVPIDAPAGAATGGAE
ncbi:hypothetical protein Htur_5093 (plasmid) [Haloterrigena turkmenica DSM 5511]|uniref:Uncharacterized protein n=1 Tax=Haloterrigena turkmenica (strain ATCC 51198 / DSM 5511 / JCM 9101 / NCIMB 13204 / VKM B-1734 / 4k) TaxID=543526 RepID=D2S3N3_HALTV|nr:hypothetical protein [Haloterrigena turkmenica]ADB63980.1 hypothetical protein Htur_5093 [Haloterrigena turkmenica DSM 5511]